MNPPALIGTGEPPQIVEIRSVHGQNKVESLEVVELDFPSALVRNIDAISRGDRDRTWIRRRSVMPAARSGGINNKATFPSLSRHNLPKNSLGQRRAANVAQTYEQN